ncbi:MAG: phytanoyl-CoA dioxygenase family protein [Verrucomicrobia bacterium]|nr:phytanoyl-CoA dioxygenase family protein [Verrucomicrobiota bacterium]
MTSPSEQDLNRIVADYQRDGVVVLRHFFSAEEVAEVRAEVERYIRDDLATKPADAATREADGVTVRNLWRLEQHNEKLRALAASPAIRDLVAPLVHGEPVLAGIETFNKPARIGSGVPYHQDNAYFCQTPPDMLTVWIALDAVTAANGPVFFVKGSHKLGALPTKPSGVRGNSIGMAEPSAVPLAEQFCGLLAPGDATIHHCNTIHHSAPNTTDFPRLGFLLVFRGRHTQTDPTLKATYTIAATATPPA